MSKKILPGIAARYPPGIGGEHFETGYVYERRTMMVRISCAGVSAGPLWIPPFRLESGELVCLHMPCLSSSEEERLVIQLLTGEFSDPNISHNGRIFLADAPICRAGFFGLFRWPRVGAWLQKKAGISAPEAQAIATRL